MYLLHTTTEKPDTRRPWDTICQEKLNKQTKHNATLRKPSESSDIAGNTSPFQQTLNIEDDSYYFEVQLFLVCSPPLYC